MSGGRAVLADSLGVAASFFHPRFAAVVAEDEVVGLAALSFALPLAEVAVILVSAHGYGSSEEIKHLLWSGASALSV